MKLIQPLLLALACMGVLAAGCGSSSTSTGSGSPSGASGAGSQGSEGPLKLALVPSEDAEKMAEGFEPIRAQLAKDLGREVDMVKVTDYANVIEAMKAGKVDVAWYGPLSMVLARREAGARPIVVARIEGKGDVYHSLILVKASSPVKDIPGLKGLKMALVDPGSTSGNLVPRFAIKTATGKKAEDLLGRINYAGSHDAALLALASGTVDACGVQDITFDDKSDKGEIKKSDYRVVYRSADLPQSPLAVRGDMKPDLEKKIVDSLAGMDSHGIKMDVPGMGVVQKFIKIGYDAYKPIEDLSDQLGLTKKDMAK